MKPASTNPRLEELAAAVVGRTDSLFKADMARHNARLRDAIRNKRILVIGGAGSIGASTIRVLLAHSPAALHVVDISENGLADFVRMLRGSPDRVSADDFRTLPLDFGSPVMERLLAAEGRYDVVMNFAAIKHVRSEKDLFSLLQMLDTNVVKPARFMRALADTGFTGRYFSVSTDKAANPVNAMGTSKRIMEMLSFSPSFLPNGATATSARFANVAFSNGSLLASFLHRIAARQPLAAPRDTRRFFITLAESGEICALAGLLGSSNTIAIPLLTTPDLIEVGKVAELVLRMYGFEPHYFTDEAAAKRSVAADVERGQYPLLLTPLDTSGEKPYEEFIGRGESLEASDFASLGLLRPAPTDDGALQDFVERVSRVLDHPEAAVTKEDVLEWMADLVPHFEHVETGVHLDSRL